MLLTQFEQFCQYFAHIRIANKAPGPDNGFPGPAVALDGPA